MHYAKNALRKVMGTRDFGTVTLQRHHAASKIPAHHEDYIPTDVLNALNKTYYAVNKVPGLRVASGLVPNEELTGAYQPLPKLIDSVIQEGEGHAILPYEDPEILKFACDMYNEVGGKLEEVLQQRKLDEAFIRDKTAVLEAKNQRLGYSYEDPKRKTIIGEKDSSGRVIVGSLSPGDANHVAIPDDFQVDVPKHLQGPHITLFGPHQDPSMARHAINCIGKDTGNTVLDDLVNTSKIKPFWGADGEDSTIPDAHDNAVGQHTLKGAFDLREKQKAAGGKPSTPLKRIPGIAIPDPKHLYNGKPLPMHLLEFAAHIYRHQNNPEALSFYIPKIETEEEAAYLKLMIETAEKMVQKSNPNYKLGTVKVIIVFETARATFRMKEIAYRLSPYFVGGSLGWHDYLASGATLFRGVKDYQIPVKSDSDIVQKHIRESHELLAQEMHSIGAKAIGGMYGFLPVKGKNAEETEKSYRTTMAYYIKDVIAQLHRGLDGFWVAHPQFVRLGIALTEAYDRDKKAGILAKPESNLFQLIDSLFTKNIITKGQLKHFISTVDQSPTLDRTDPKYPLAVLAANLKTSDVLANNDPKEVEYNAYQAVEYLCSWFMGTGCVALPTTLKTPDGDPVGVRVMDDLATTERSLSEMWAEIRWERFTLQDFDQIVEKVALKRLQERQLEAIQKTRQLNGMIKLQQHKKITSTLDDIQDTQLKASDIPSKTLAQHDKWMNVAQFILKLYVRLENPPKNITELLLLSTLDVVKHSDDPLSALQRIAASKYTLRKPLQTSL